MDVFNASGKPVLLKAYCMWTISKPGGKSFAVPTAGSGTRTYKIFNDNSGEASLLISYTNESGYILETILNFPADKNYFTLKQSVTSSENGALNVENVQALTVSAGRDGGFFPGSDVSSTWVLENGYKKFYDFFVRLVKADDVVYSNWDAAYYDVNSQETFLAGFVTAEHGFVSIRSFMNKEKAPVENGVTGLPSFRADVEYDPAASLKPGEKFEAETLMIGISSSGLPHYLLESFAEQAAIHSGGPAFVERLKNLEVPTGWNSWATTYHHAITEENMTANAELAATLFLPFGMTTFQVDDGYQKTHGDWFANEKFPGGMKAMGEKIAALGFTPGLWSMPFCVSTDSDIAREHPDWIAPKNQMGETLMPKDWLILDPTHPEVQNWLGETYNRISNEWGFKVNKIDFIYFVQLAKKYYDPDATAVDAYRTGIRIVREAIGDDGFLIAVGVPVANSVGIADALRLGLDVTPDWQDETTMMAQGVKPMVRNLAHRYYLNGRAWYNHPDMFYLGAPEEMERWGNVLSLEKARAYATLASINGGIVKIGDSFLGLDDVRINLYRRLIPVYASTARPMDLFEKYYPEVWTLPVDSPFGDYSTLTLFNWGKNEIYGEKRAEATQDYSMPLSFPGVTPDKKYVVAETWSNEFAGVFQGEFKTSLDPGTVKVFTFNELSNRPQIISSSRHITMTKRDFNNIVWDEAANTLSAEQQAIQGFDYEILIYVPDGYEPISGSGGSYTVEWNKPVATVSFNPDASGPLPWSVSFAKPSNK